MNRINKRLLENDKILSIYFTAGFPQAEDTLPVIRALQENGADMIEIGLPFSDPLADGPTIQESSVRALSNGMTTRKLFNQLKEVRNEIHIPLIIMGYFNPILQYGVEEFCAQCAATGIDGLIIPDLPVDVYKKEYRKTFEKYGLANIFLITPQTPEARIRFIDDMSDAFIYMVSSASVTGAKNSFGEQEQAYFKRIADLGLKNPCIAGFGISNAATFKQATAHTKGAIIGSAFIRHLSENGLGGIGEFMGSIREVKKIL